MYINFGRDIDSLLHTKKAKAEVPVPEVSMDEKSESETEPMAQEEDSQPKITLLVSSNTFIDLSVVLNTCTCTFMYSLSCIRITPEGFSYKML